MNANNQEFRFDAMDIMMYIWKRKIPLLIITVAAGIISIIGSLMITPKFKSSVILFAAAEGSAGKVMIQENYQKNMQDIGDEEQVEPVMQVLKSNKIRNKIIERYNLMQHYLIDTTAPYPYYKLYKYYESNVQIKR